jgi:hypothetical protein
MQKIKTANQEILNLHNNRRQTRGSKMSEWDTVTSVLGTLGGTALGLVFGYLTASHLETKRQKHEKEITPVQWYRWIMKS